MSTSRPPLTLLHPTRSDRLARISRQPAVQPERVMIAVARGAKRTQLTDSRLYGPFLEPEADAAEQQVLAGLFSEGYLAAGTASLLEGLAASEPGPRARAARRAGWRRERQAVEALLAIADKPREDISSVVEALGRIQDLRAVPLLRAEAERKLLSRRRAGIEALRMLGDEEGLAAAHQRALARLPEPVRTVIAGVVAGSSGDDGAHRAELVKAVRGLDAKERGLAVDTLYELGTPLCVFAAREILLSLDIAAPHTWRYAKSVLKRAMLRIDADTVGALFHRVEIRGRTSKGTKAKLKSGRDGEVRETRVFARVTVDYVRRLVWRWLRLLARHQPDEYPQAAAAIVSCYTLDDDVTPQGRLPATGRSYLLHRVVWGASKRYVLDERRLRFHLRSAKHAVVPAGVREEAFGSLWDAAPRAYLTLLVRARHPAVLRMGLEAVKVRHPRLLEVASGEELASLVGHDDEQVAELGFVELRRRFDPSNPDLSVVAGLLSSQSERAQELGVQLLTDSAHVWTRSPQSTLAFVGLGAGSGREAAARLFVAASVGLPGDIREALAIRLVALLSEKEPTEGAFSGYAEAARALRPEVARLVSFERALELLQTGSDSAAELAGLVLAAATDALQRMGPGRVLELASSSSAAARRAALAAVEGATSELQRNPGLLLSLAESDWDDVRALAARLLSGVDPTALSFDAWLGLLDSTRVEVQRVAQKLVTAHIERFEAHDLLTRLAQHPHRNMRAFVVDLAITHLRPGFVRLGTVEPMLRAVLFDVRPDRALRTRVLDFLVARGMQDGAQAELSAALLGEVVRSQTHDVQERALRGIVELKLAFPELPVAVRVAA